MEEAGRSRVPVAEVQLSDSPDWRRAWHHFGAGALVFGSFSPHSSSALQLQLLLLLLVPFVVLLMVLALLLVLLVAEVGEAQ